MKRDRSLSTSGYPIKPKPGLVQFQGPGKSKISAHRVYSLPKSVDDVPTQIAASQHLVYSRISIHESNENISVH